MTAVPLCGRSNNCLTFSFGLIQKSAASEALSAVGIITERMDREESGNNHVKVK